MIDIKEQYMKESSILADSVANNYLESQGLVNTKGQYMKESRVSQRLETSLAGQSDNPKISEPFANK